MRQTLSKQALQHETLLQTSWCERAAGGCVRVPSLPDHTLRISQEIVATTIAATAENISPLKSKGSERPGVPVKVDCPAAWGWTIILWTLTGDSLNLD